MRRALVIGSVVAVLAAAATAMAGGNGVVASANGDYGFSGQAAGSTFEIGPFTWNVQVKADGSVERAVRLHAGTRRRRPLGERPADAARSSRATTCGSAVSSRRARGRASSASTCGSRLATTGRARTRRRTCPRRSAPQRLRRASSTAPTIRRCGSPSSSARATCRCEAADDGRGRAGLVRPGPRRPEVRRVRARGSDPA